MIGIDRVFMILYVDDLTRETVFYRDVIGLQVGYSEPGWVQFGTKMPTLVLHLKTTNQKASAVVGNLTHPAFQVDDLESEYERLHGHNVTFKTPPASAQFGKHATFLDPEGNEIDLLEWRNDPQRNVTGETLVNDIVANHPETMEVFECHGIRICGGCLVLLNAPVHVTAEYSGLNREESSSLVAELNIKLDTLESDPGSGTQRP